MCKKSVPGSKLPCGNYLFLTFLMYCLVGISPNGFCQQSDQRHHCRQSSKRTGLWGRLGSACAMTHLTYDASDDVWEGTWTVPAGSYEYKAALNDSWTENYGLHAVLGGANIPLSLGASKNVKFYYDHKTHWIIDNQTSIIAVATGMFPERPRLPGDWTPVACVLARDTDGTAFTPLKRRLCLRGATKARLPSMRVGT